LRFIIPSTIVLKASIQGQEALIQVKVSIGKELELNFDFKVKVEVIEKLKLDFNVKVKGIEDLHLINSQVVHKPKDEEKVRERARNCKHKQTL